MDTSANRPQPTLHDRLLVRLTVIRERMQRLREKIEDSATTAVLAEQYLIELSQLEYEEAFLRDALNIRESKAFGAGSL